MATFNGMNRAAAARLSVEKTQVHDGQKIAGWQWSLPLDAGAGVVADDEAPSEYTQVEHQHVH